jgi:hypothetical protein
LARTRRRGDNAGMAGDDGRAQVQLDEDTLARRRRDLGEDHPDTLAAASNLAVSLRAAGEYQAARELDEDTLARRSSGMATPAWLPLCLGTTTRWTWVALAADLFRVRSPRRLGPRASS